MPLRSSRSFSSGEMDDGQAQDSIRDERRAEHRIPGRRRQSDRSGVRDASALIGLLQGGASDEALVATILGSAEYYASRGNDSSDGLLSAMYCDAVFRAIDQATQNNDDFALTNGTSRGLLAASLLSTTEYLDKLVNGYYLRFLRRNGTPSSLATFAAFIHGGGTSEQVIAKLLSSSEYFDLVNPTVAFVTTTVAKGGTITTTLRRTVRLTLTVLRILPAVQDAARVTLHAPHTRRVDVVSFSRRHKGRVKLHWKGRVNGGKPKHGRYLLILKAYRGHTLVGLSDALPFTVR